MIIKRSLRAQMQTLKRCKAQDPADSVGGGGKGYLLRNTKRHRGGGANRFPFEFLGGLPVTVGIPYTSFDVMEPVSGEEMEPSCCTGGLGDCCGASWTRRRSRSPVLRTRRRRPLELPSRLCDSGLIGSTSGNEGNTIGDDLIMDSMSLENSALFEEDCYRACRNIKVMKRSLSCSNLTYLHEVSEQDEEIAQPALDYSNGQPRCLTEFFSMSTTWEEALDETELSEDFRRPKEFALGDVVWAKKGKSYPAWPAVIINPKHKASKSIPESHITMDICVMFFGCRGCGDGKQKYAFVKQEMVFPFIDYMDRFQGQTELYKSKPSDLRLAIEEAFMAEHGFTSMALDSEGMTMLQAHPNCVVPGEYQEATGSNEFQPQHSWLKRSCGICRKPLCQTDYQSLVSCGGCQTWIHAKCAKTYIKQGLDDGDYYCAECKLKPNFDFSDTEKKNVQNRYYECSLQESQPEKIPVCCYGMDGIYLPEQHMVVCHCPSCKGKKSTPSEWERHTGSRSKNWKTSVKVKSTMTPLGKWLGHHLADTTSANIGKRLPLTERKQKLVASLLERYEPVYTKWTTERCAICRWIEDWDYNKIIICIRCQVAVHQECYGVRGELDFTSWVCRACETPEQKQECCLCPVKGGALKPTDVDSLWVHVTCAWFQPGVSFASDETMEPAVGILNIPLQSFMKICVICKQKHGSCTQCCRCSTYYHAMCASRAGYRMELHCFERNGIPTTKKLSFCSFHRAPNPDTVLVIHTPLGVFSAKDCLRIPTRNLAQD
ncbi:hypothetical protein HPP92_009761 [Vanilla planifolia]|uniref:Histone-lysine N-methyltransferase ATX3 n=1 Tax=Vanilla planifolia TaxID=51239 RepID=A0A835REI5_VANPL|nr:hypothetical protein HPP92_009761 [Vanilla planifolia]